MMNYLRNIAIMGFFGFLALIICAYVSAAIFIGTVFGWETITADLAIIEYQYKYIIWTIKNSNKLSLDYKDYFIVKLIVPPIFIFSIFFSLVYRNWEKIFNLRPYKKKESIHGDASWATEDDIKAAGLRSKQGMLLGQDKNGYFIAEGYQHALLFAPTGSGKGVGFVIPNLLYWDDSIIVHDIKLENYELTSGYRKNKLKQNVFVWAPADPEGITHCYNPIDWVSPKPGQMVDDVQKIANLIMPEKEFWNNEARSLFVGIVLYLIAVPEKVKSFGEVVRTMRSDDVTYNLAVVLDTIGQQIHPVAYMNIAAFLQKAEKERSGVISTMNSSLELWANPLIDTATSFSDFNIKNFKKERTTVYVGLTPDNIKRLEPLMQVFYQQATEFLTRKIPDKKEEPYGVMFMMDEFPTLGKMEQFKTGIAYFRGYNVRLFLIIQDTEQLKGTYEEAGMNSFLSNSTYRITFAANNMETANLISQLCGNKTAQQESMNRPKYLDLNPATRSLHVSEVQRALLLPQEVILLPRDEQIVLIESSPPIKSKKIKYYEDRFFKKRLLPPIELPVQEPFDPRKHGVNNMPDSQGASKNVTSSSEEAQIQQPDLLKEPMPLEENPMAGFDELNAISHKKEDDSDSDFDDRDFEDIDEYFKKYNPEFNDDEDEDEDEDEFEDANLSSDDSTKEDLPNIDELMKKYEILDDEDEEHENDREKDDNLKNQQKDHQGDEQK